MRRTFLCAALFAAVPALGDGAAGIQWTPPAGWIADQPRPMRAATYRIPAAKGDTEGGECAVFFFGSGQGGTVDANVQRWVGQFEQPDGKPSASLAKRDSEKIKDLQVTHVEVGGTYTGAGGPMAQGAVKKPGFKLLGAIVEAPQGPVFFKLTAPAKTADAARADFKKLLKSVSH
jgi:hypothetical protein